MAGRPAFGLGLNFQTLSSDFFLYGMAFHEWYLVMRLNLLFSYRRCAISELKRIRVAKSWLSQRVQDFMTTVDLTVNRYSAFCDNIFAVLHRDCSSTLRHHNINYSFYNRGKITGNFFHKLHWLLASIDVDTGWLRIKPIMSSSSTGLFLLWSCGQQLVRVMLVGQTRFSPCQISPIS